MAKVKKSVLGKRKRGDDLKGTGTLVSSQSGGTSTMTTRQPVVPRSFQTKMYNSECVRVVNTEVLNSGWPVSTGTFGVTGRYLQPAGNLAWASSIGINFSQYRFRKLRFHYKPIVGTNSVGYFAMAFVSDPEDVTSIDTFTVGNSLSRMANCRRYVQVPVWQEATLEVKPSDFSSDWYIFETVSISDQSTARQCAAGGLFLAAQATDAAATGIIYVEYELEFKDPVSSFANR
nr:MAG: hypothetical protein [Narnaviridae sp.]